MKINHSLGLRSEKITSKYFRFNKSLLQLKYIQNLHLLILSRIWWNVYLHRNKIAHLKDFYNLCENLMWAGRDSTSAVPESLPCLGNELYFKHSPAGLPSSLSDPRAGGECLGGFTFKLCGFVEKTPVSLLGCWCEHRSWGQGQAWCSWWTLDAPPSAAAAPVHQFPATGTGRRDPRTLAVRK